VQSSYDCSANASEAAFAELIAITKCLCQRSTRLVRKARRLDAEREGVWVWSGALCDRGRSSHRPHTKQDL